MKITSLSLIAFLIAAPLLHAGDLSPKKGWRTRNLAWMKKDARWIANEVPESSKWRARDLKWMEKDIRWHEGEAKENAPWKKREARFRTHDAG